MEQRFHFESVRAFPFVLELTIGMLRLRSYYEIVWDSCDLTSFHLTYFTLALDQIVKSKTALNISPIISHKKNYFNKLNTNTLVINFNFNFVQKFPILKSRRLPLDTLYQKPSETPITLTPLNFIVPITTPTVPSIENDPSNRSMLERGSDRSHSPALCTTMHFMHYTQSTAINNARSWGEREEGWWSIRCGWKGSETSCQKDGERRGERERELLLL